MPKTDKGQPVPDPTSVTAPDPQHLFGLTGKMLVDMLVAELIAQIPGLLRKGADWIEAQRKPA